MAQAKADGHRNVTMREADWMTVGLLAAHLGGSRSHAIRMAVRFAFRHLGDLIEFTATQKESH